MPLLKQLLGARAAEQSTSMEALCASMLDKPILFVANKTDALASFSPESSSNLPCSPAWHQEQVSSSIAAILDHPDADFADVRQKPEAQSATARSSSIGMHSSTGPSAANSADSSATCLERSADKPREIGGRPEQIHWISCHTSQGMQSLEQHLEKAVAHVIHGNAIPSSPPLTTRQVNFIALLCHGRTLSLRCCALGIEA